MNNLLRISHSILIAAGVPADAATFRMIHEIMKGGEDVDGSVAWGRMTTKDIAEALGETPKATYKLLKAAQKAGYVKSIGDFMRENVTRKDDVGADQIGWSYWETEWDPETGEMRSLLPSEDIKHITDMVVNALLATDTNATKNGKDKVVIPLSGDRGQLMWTANVYKSFGDKLVVTLVPKVKMNSVLKSRSAMIEFLIKNGPRLTAEDVSTRDTSWLNDLMSKFNGLMAKIQK